MPVCSPDLLLPLLLRVVEALFQDHEIRLRVPYTLKGERFLHLPQSHADSSLDPLVIAVDQPRAKEPCEFLLAETSAGGNQGAQSPAGAIGVMQLMPDTAASLGVNPYDKQQNIEGGAKYLRQMLDSFGGDVKKAVAAYNAGPNAVKKYGGIPPYPETQSYVDKVLDLYQ